MYNNIDFLDVWQNDNILFVDVRSESEYEQDHIPGAINIPVFSDEERKHVGTVYKQVSPKAARTLALEIVSPKLPEMVQKYEKLAQTDKIVIYCWRGGERSQAIQTILNLMRVPNRRLKGGYKAYRQIINQCWQEEFPFPVVVLHGLTGVGKTRIIKELANLGAQVLDLEGLAGNRGSAFGNVGLPPQPSQKDFESKIWQEIQKFDTAKPIIVECESKRIGRLLVPDNIHNAMKSGKHILAYDTIPNRIEKIVEDYAPEQMQTEIIEAITRLKDRLGKNTVSSLIENVKLGQYSNVVEVLLTKYYDPLYTYPCGPSEDFVYSVDAADCTMAAVNISKYLCI